MDPELRDYLEAMEQRAIARDAETRQVAAAARAVAEAAFQTGDAARLEAAAARREAADGRREARVMHEQTMDAIKALGDGLSTAQRHEVDRGADERHQALMNAHVAPLEAAARSAAAQLSDHEGRITGLERRTAPQH